MFGEFGADTLRVYEMSMGPLDASRPWETRAVVGAFRFLQRVWRNVVSEQTGDVVAADRPMDEETCRIMHRTIDAVRSDLSALRLNTAIARLIELNNHLTRLEEVPRDAAEALVLMLSPLAPHICEELWSRLGHPQSLAYEPFPVADPEFLVEQTVTCIVQVSGKVRDRLEVPVSIDEEALREQALASDAVRRALAGRPVRTVVVRAPRLVNVVPGQT
jgi:leucyl-tRNA synthetase